MNTFVFTSGDVNGIGPEIVIKTVNKVYNKKNKIVLILPGNVFINTIQIVPPKFPFVITKDKNEIKESGDNVVILNTGSAKQSYGKVSAVTGKISYKSIIKACELTNEKYADAIITAPISKEALKKANINFPGHTELLAKYFNVKKYVMMFASNKMKAALATIHIPVKEISKNITYKKLKGVSEIIIESLIKDFNITQPKIALLGLNPHAGENGNIGKEEKTIIEKIITENKKYLFGPFVPDAYFGNKLFKNYDCTIGMYHDQILIPFKLLNFNKGVNYTAGLPVVRTSPDHGTAFDIAGKGIAKPDSMIEAFKLAGKIINSRKKNAEES